jgi:RNA polymerase sigma-70 factor (ECF subfamily)
MDRIESPAVGLSAEDGNALDAEALRAEIGSHRATLLRVARLQLRDGDLAEDVVQETLLAAVRAAPSYEGRGRVLTWLVGILKFKVIDALRARARAPVNVSSLGEGVSTDDIDALFDAEGTWRSTPGEWGDPTHRLTQSDFQRVLEACLTRLPALPARVFMLRELFDVEPEEVCRLVEITRNHLNVLLYRARLSLRRCLEVHWMDDPKGASR